MQEGREEIPDLVSLVELPEWKSILLDLVKKERMDPWNIDLVDLTHKYLDRVRKMQENNLYVPANALLACAILLNMKADVLRQYYRELEEENSVEQEPMEEVPFDGFLMAETFVDAPAPEDENTQEPIAPEDILPPTRITTRRVSLEELLVAMERVMRAKKRLPRKKAEPIIDYEAPLEELFEEMDRDAVDQYIEDTYARVLETLDSEGLTTLSNIVDRKEPLDVIRKLLSLLYLTNQGKINIWQERPFDEVFITVVNDEAQPEENH